MASIYSSFGTHGLAAFDLGKLVWRRKSGINNITATRTRLYKDSLFIFQDRRRDWIVRRGLQRRPAMCMEGRSAGVGWGHRRRDAGIDELIISSQQVAYDPDTGAELWTVRGFTGDSGRRHGLVFCSSGAADAAIGREGTSRPRTSRGRRRGDRRLCHRRSCTAISST
jgi:hypothetical protein